MSAVLLFILVPAIVLGTICYAILAEMRHNRVHRSRWELHVARGHMQANPARLPARPVGAG